MYELRTYRCWVKDDDLIRFEVVVKETDLFIRAEKNLRKKALRACLKHRSRLEKYISQHPEFLNSLQPVRVKAEAPYIVKEMAQAGEEALTGPMAAVAGAIADCVGQELLPFSSEVIVENGGDIFLKVSKKRLVGIYAGDSPLSGRIALEVEPQETPLGVCTSSGTVGPSLSFGRTDAVVVLSKSTALADAAATAIGNLVREEADISRGLELAQRIPGLQGTVIIKGGEMGLWGKVRVKPVVGVAAGFMRGPCLEP